MLWTKRKKLMLKSQEFFNKVSKLHKNHKKCTNKKPKHIKLQTIKKRNKQKTTVQKTKRLSQYHKKIRENLANTF